MMFCMSGIGSHSFEQSPASVEKGANGDYELVPDKMGGTNNLLKNPQLHQKEGNTIGQTMEWILAMIMGLGLMLGLLFFIV